MINVPFNPRAHFGRASIPLSLARQVLGTPACPVLFSVSLVGDTGGRTGKPRPCFFLSPFSEDRSSPRELQLPSQHKKQTHNNQTQLLISQLELQLERNSYLGKFYQISWNILKAQIGSRRQIARFMCNPKAS